MNPAEIRKEAENLIFYKFVGEDNLDQIKKIENLCLRVRNEALETAAYLADYWGYQAEGKIRALKSGFKPGEQK